jgi:hypothetical protein
MTEVGGSHNVQENVLIAHNSENLLRKIYHCTSSMYVQTAEAGPTWAVGDA